jgi:uroporphyrinogen-III synthase
VESTQGVRGWRVAVTRDEPADGPLSTALRLHRLTPVPCPVLVEGPPADPDALADAANTLEQYDWVVAASARAVRAITRARGGPWPADIRTAAVGAATAAALAEAGVTRPTLVAPEPGAEALVTLLAEVDWLERRVLVPTTPGGRTILAEHLRAAWAMVDEVEAYAMHPRAPGDIARDWHAAAPDAAVIASPRVAELLAAAIDVDGLRALRLVISIGATTRLALERLGVTSETPAHADFAECARLLADAVRREAAR